MQCFINHGRTHGHIMCTKYKGNTARAKMYTTSDKWDITNAIFT